MKINKFDPSPIHLLSESYNGNSIHMKREDLLPISFGGNKARKGILFFEEIEELGSDYIVTYGSSSSNHCRVIANMAAARKIPCLIISPIESRESTYNSKIVQLFGSKVILCPVNEVSSTIDSKMEELNKFGYKPYFIQGGGHGDVGTQSYVDVYDEIVEYEQMSGVYFDYIFLTSGTGSTQAGLVCGKLLHEDYGRKIIGISNARKNPTGGKVVLDSVNSYLNSMGKNSVGSEEILFIDEFILDGYSSYNNEVLQTIKDVLTNDGISMDTTYTGKGFWGMKMYINDKNISGKKVLFIHTGGTPLFFDDMEVLVDDR